MHLDARSEDILEAQHIRGRQKAGDIGVYPSGTTPDCSKTRRHLIRCIQELIYIFHVYPIRWLHTQSISNYLCHSSNYIYIYIYIYMCVCMCVCVCVFGPIHHDSDQIKSLRHKNVDWWSRERWERNFHKSQVYSIWCVTYNMKRMRVFILSP